MKTDIELVHEYVDQRISKNLRSSIIRELADRQHEVIKSIQIPNVSSLHVEDKDGYLITLGLSNPNDLITENFGYFLASCFAPNVRAAPNWQPQTNTGGGGQTIQVQNNAPAPGGSTSNAWPYFGDSRISSVGPFQVRLGSGATTVARTDFNVETGLVSSPESGWKTVSGGAGFVGATNSVDFSQSVGAFGGNETVRESAVAKTGIAINITPVQSVWFRYNYSDTPIFSGQSVTMDVSLFI